MSTKEWTLGTKNAVGINMASKVRSRLKFLSPHVDEKVFKSLQKRISPRKTSKALESVKGGSRERVEDVFKGLKWRRFCSEDIVVHCKLVCRLSTSLCSKVDIQLFFKGQTILKAAVKGALHENPMSNS